MVEGGVANQTERALANLGAVLEASASDLGQVVRTTVMLRDMADFEQFNAAYAAAFAQAKGPDPIFPARTTFAAAGLPKGALVEIDCVALLAPRG
jgi:2-iminobutanoate/2-iminopropanoate deaminase